MLIFFLGDVSERLTVATQKNTMLVAWCFFIYVIILNEMITKSIALLMRCFFLWTL